ncbi:hypothetical protein Tco_0121228 [Tanacetum coccineum]
MIKPLVIWTQQNIFEVNHEDAYDSDVDEGPNAAAAFMANLSSTSATNSQVNEDRTLRIDAETEIDDNTIPYHRIILTLKPKMFQLRYLLDTSDKVKIDLENKVRQEQALVIQRNKRNAELVQENDLLKVTLSGKEKSIAFLQSEKEKILSEKKDLADSYLDEICERRGRARYHNRKLYVVDNNQFGFASLMSGEYRKHPRQNYDLTLGGPTRIALLVVLSLRGKPLDDILAFGSLIVKLSDSIRWVGSKGFIWSKGRTVADSIAERLTRPTAYKFKTDCSIIPVWVF